MGTTACPAPAPATTALCDDTHICNVPYNGGTSNKIGTDQPWDYGKGWSFETCSTTCANNAECNFFEITGIGSGGWCSMFRTCDFVSCSTFGICGSTHRCTVTRV